jgi:GT2 family glycosyltransferase
MQAKLDIQIATLTHPGYLPQTERHLRSLIDAIGERKYGVKLFINNATDESITWTNEIVSRLNYSNIVVSYTKENLSTAAARNRIVANLDSEFIFFSETDTFVSPVFFSQLENYARDPRFWDAHAYLGGVGIESYTVLGYWEGVMDIVVLLSGLSSVRARAFFQIHWGEITNAYFSPTHLPEILDSFALEESRYLQAFNMLIRRDALNLVGGFDERFFSADDREISEALRVYGLKILFLPQCVISHNYSFSLGRLIYRKVCHGFWGYHKRRKYQVSRRRLGWLGYASYYKTIILPPHPFNESAISRIYYAISTISFEWGRMLAALQLADPISKCSKIQIETKSSPRG